MISFNNLFDGPIDFGRGVARVMNMCTHNARGKDLRSFSETGRECISPNSWLPYYGGTPTQATRSSRRGGGRGLPRKQIEKRSQIVASDGICGKDNFCKIEYSDKIKN